MQVWSKPATGSEDNAQKRKSDRHQHQWDPHQKQNIPPPSGLGDIKRVNPCPNEHRFISF